MAAKATHAVVSWAKAGEEELHPEQLEPVSLKKLITKGTPAPGSEVLMQYRKELWRGSILSLHGSQGSAAAAIKKDFTEESSSSCADPGTKRKRVSKDFGKDFQACVNDSDGEVSAKQKELVKKPKKKNPAEKSKELELLSSQLHSIQTSILPVASDSDDCDMNSDSESDRLSERAAGPSTSTPKHPRFGQKCPKQHAPPKCINMACKEKKEQMEEEINNLKAEVSRLKEQLLESSHSGRNGATGNASSEMEPVRDGKISRDIAIAHGLTELTNGSGVWICPNKLTAAVKDAEHKSRKVLVRSLISIFYAREELLEKCLAELDRDVVEACVDFAMVAKLPEVAPAKKANLRQALRCKLNSMKFAQTKPGYFKEYRKNPPKKPRKKPEMDLSAES